MSEPFTITLYSKPGCHLCEDARALLDELQPDFGFIVGEVDITRDEDLFARYRHDIPVLVMNGAELARGNISESDLVRVLKNNTKKATTRP